MQRERRSRKPSRVVLERQEGKRQEEEKLSQPASRPKRPKPKSPKPSRKRKDVQSPPTPKPSKKKKSFVSDANPVSSGDEQSGEVFSVCGFGSFGVVAHSFVCRGCVSPQVCLQTQPSNALLSLVPDPRNKKDPNAIKVMLGEKQMGFLSKTIAKVFAPIMAHSALRISAHGPLWVKGNTIQVSLCLSTRKTSPKKEDSLLSFTLQTLRVHFKDSQPVVVSSNPQIEEKKV